MRIVMLGAPGSGKGTQADLISQLNPTVHLSTGDVLRAEMKQQTELGKKVSDCVSRGDLVSDDLMVELIRKRISALSAETGFILDGFPRTVEQARQLDSILVEYNMPLTAVIELVINDDDFIVNRLSGRRICPNGHGQWHVEYNKPKVDGLCDKCSAELVQRNDDVPEKIINRLRLYEEMSKPVSDYYAELNLLKRFDAAQDKSVLSKLINDAVMV